MAAKLIINNHLRALTASPPPLSSALSTFQRKLHESAYEKEVEDEVEVDANVEVIAPVEDAHQPEEYWEPDPETGVFVPASEHSSDDPVVVQMSCTTEETVLDEKAFFRPQEDLEAPPPESFTGEMPPVDPFADSE